MEEVKCYWHVSDNFGDALTPYLIKKISGKNAVYVDRNSDASLVTVTGSILSYNVNRGTVWGTGCAFESDLDPKLFVQPSEIFKIKATRGLLSTELVMKSGHRPDAVGDPGFLISKYYNPSDTEKKYKAGIVCSWVDYNDVLAMNTDSDVLVINSQIAVEKMIDTMHECEVLVCSTLHGFVTAVAYNIPTILVKFSDRMVGDGFKFRDVYTCINEPFEMVDLTQSSVSISELISRCSKRTLSIDLNNLINCCPFRMDSE